MGNINRTNDASEQKRCIDVNIRETVTGESDHVMHAPHALTIVGCQLAAEGLSGTPTVQLKIQRFVTGAGETQIALGPAVTPISVGTSGPVAFAFSTTLLQAGDQVVATHAGTNAALAQLGIALVVQATQDIKSWDF